MRRIVLPTLALLLSAPPLAGQAGHDHERHTSPYAGEMEDRAVKALGEEELQGLLDGAGLGFALAAELNGSPGPRHVLDLAEELRLTAEQRQAVEGVRARMEAEARRLGARVVEEERHLDRMFALGHATAGSVRERTGRIGALRGELRAVHLVAHLEAAALLAPEQVEDYRRLRGYSGATR